MSADRYSVRFGRSHDGDGKVGDVLYGWRAGALTEIEAKRASINSGAGETQKARYAYA